MYFSFQNRYILGNSEIVCYIVVDTFTKLGLEVVDRHKGQLPGRLNICNDNLKASDMLLYDVASLSNFPKSSLMAVHKEVVSFSNFGLMAKMGVSNSSWHMKRKFVIPGIAIGVIAIIIAVYLVE